MIWSEVNAVKPARCLSPLRPSTTRVHVRSVEVDRAGPDPDADKRTSRDFVFFVSIRSGALSPDQDRLSEWPGTRKALGLNNIHAIDFALKNFVFFAMACRVSYNFL